MAKIDPLLQELKKLLKERKVTLPRRELEEFLGLIDEADHLIPTSRERAILVHLLHVYEHTKKKVIIQLEDSGGERFPITVSLAVLAEDWRGLANSVVGIIHQKKGNVLYLKVLTFPYRTRMVASILLAFELQTQEDYERFLAERSHLLQLIRDASQGTEGKTLLLEDETLRFEMYNQAINRIKRIYKQKDIDGIIGENGEALKFFSSRSREYLEERKISDLTEMIIDNHRFQKMVRSGEAEKKIKIKNFETQYEKLTGIHFVCRKDNFSVEHFLKTLEFIVPGHIIKHHKSFVTGDGILVYRIEIVDSEENPLDPETIKSIESSLDKMILSTADEAFCQVKTIGGFEHFARAIIPFLMEELQRTNLSQAYLSADKKNEFLIDMKLIVVTFKSERIYLNTIIRRLEKQKGVEIYSVIPPRLYKGRIGVNIMNLQINVAEFSSIAAIFSEIKGILKKTYGAIRDFDEGLRERDLKNLEDLKKNLTTIQPHLLKEIYYNFDGIYRIETPVAVLAEIILLGCRTIKVSSQHPANRFIVTHKKVTDPLCNRTVKTVFILASAKNTALLSQIINHFPNTEVYFTRFVWRQRVYHILTLKKGNQPLNDKEIGEIFAYFRTRYPRLLVIDYNQLPSSDSC